ncbi:ribonuclease H-like domain-containing protein [Pilobolus umbonatus]|nr:ribonuclease H-like domain-containing protein [Pilobolus umbonatus]
MDQKLTKVEELRCTLEQLGLNTLGSKQQLKKRLRNAKKKGNECGEEVELKVNEKSQMYDYFLFFDVEATCVEGGGFSYPNEIIEFPVVLVDGKNFEIVDEFRSYVKPTIRPQLSDFCVKLTGIQQSVVDDSPDFIEVLDMFQQFMHKYDLFRSSSAIFVTDGPFDIRDFITKQCAHSKLKHIPPYFELPWINIRKSFKDFFHQKENKNINGMLSYLGLTFEGREHSGLDDARNLAIIGKHMHENGFIYKANCRLINNKKVYKRW